MNSPGKQLSIAFSVVVLLTISNFSPSRLSTRSSLVQYLAEPDAAKTIGIQAFAAEPATGDRIVVAGNAPCNPEQEVCNK